MSRVQRKNSSSTVYWTSRGLEFRVGFWNVPDSSVFQVFEAGNRLDSWLLNMEFKENILKLPNWFCIFSSHHISAKKLAHDATLSDMKPISKIVWIEKSLHWVAFFFQRVAVV